MNMRRLLTSAMVATVWLAADGPIVQAEFTLLGPTLYRSMADSPFDLSGLGSTFFLEDYEGPTLNTPGAELVTSFSGGLSNSVDADDGILDGNGGAGHSLSPTIIDGNGLDWWHLEAAYVFSKDELGFWPTAVGIALTVSQGAENEIGALDANGNLSRFNLNAVHSNTGDATDDLFVGLINPEGISAFYFAEGLKQRQMSARLDHFQYGLVVPEPSSVSVLIPAIGIWIWRVRRMPGS